MQVRSIFITIVLLAFTGRVIAQQKSASKDTMLKNATIEIIQSYKPEVQLAPKPEFVATLPPTDTNKPLFNYEVPTQTLYYTYNALPLRPLALNKDSLSNPYNNYAKVGIGNLSTFFMDAGIGSFKGTNYETAIQLHHLSQNGSIANQAITLSGLEATGIYHTATDTWHASFDMLRNTYHYYGYDHNVYGYNSSSVQQTFFGIHATADMQNSKPNEGGIDYHPEVKVGVYTDKYQATETNLGFNLPFSKNIDTSLKVQVGINGAITHMNAGTNGSGNNFLQIAPGISYHKQAWNAHLFLNPTFGKDQAYILPDAFISWKNPFENISVEGGFQSLLHQNTYEELSTRNPYIYNTYQIHQTETNELFAGLRSGIGDHISVAARASWWQFNKLPVFVNPFGDQKQFFVTYDEHVTAFSLQGSFRYQVGNSFSIGAGFAWFNYYKSTLDHVYHEPGIRLKSDMMMQITPKLTASAYMSLLNEIFAMGTQGESKKLGGVFDLGASAEYTFLSRLSGFIQINNILNNKYERWLGYTAYGINIYGGVRVKF
ncbi:MAG: hypothetical protein WCG87_01565 [Bacteroidota bacterium]